MTYPIDEIAALCAVRGLQFARPDQNEIEVTLLPGCVLVFQNLIKEEDTYMGFKNTPWHTHDRLTLMTGESTYIECGALDVVRGILDGEIVVVSQLLDGKLKDRWLAHKDEKLDVEYLEAGEDIHVQRIG